MDDGSLVKWYCNVKGCSNHRAYKHNPMPFAAAKRPPLVSVPSSDLLGFPPVLDVCCGGRHFWYDKQDRRAVYVDKRRETIHWGGKQRPGRCPTVVNPDYVADFRKLPLPDNTFALVVFDPPHATFGKTGIMAKTYGRLEDDWRDMIQGGFAECFRVLRPEGTLIFKWNETQIPLRKILALTPHKPLFGHLCGMRNKTHWVAFLKPNVKAEPRKERGK